MEKEIARFQKNSTEDVVFKITEYNGQDLLDIRSYMRTVPIGKEIATRKAIALRLEKFPEFFEAIKKTEK